MNGTQPTWLDAPTRWGRWLGLMSHREPGTALALVRICAGLVLLWSLSSTWSSGALDALWIGKEYGGVRSMPHPTWLVALLGGPTPGVIHGLTAAGLVGGLLMTLGLGGRVTVLFAQQVFMAVSDLNSHAGGSYDSFLQNLLWLLFLSSSTATLSLDCRLRTGRWTSDVPVLAFPRYLMVFQLVLTYWSTGMLKLSGFWTPMGGFSALYYILQQPTWQRFDLSVFAWLYPLTQLATGVTWLWEVTAPVWLLAWWYRATRERPGRLRAWANRYRLRLIYAGIGATMHLALWVVFNVGPFSPLSLTYYLALFHPDEYARLWRRLRPQEPAHDHAHQHAHGDAQPQ